MSNLYIYEDIEQSKNKRWRLAGRLHFPFLLLLLLLALKVTSQPIKPMGKGLTKRVECACKDSLGRLYAFTQSADSIFVNRWDTAAKTWSVYSILHNTFKAGASKANCHFLYNELLVTGIEEPGPKTGIYSYKGGTWSKIAIAKHYNDAVYSGLTSFKFRNRIFFAGEVDSIAGIDSVGVVVYNGSSFSPSLGLKIKPGTKSFSFDERSDTLFFAYKDIIYTYHSNAWKFYYQSASGKQLYNMAVVGSDLFVSEVSSVYSSLKRISYGQVVDSTIVPVINPRLFSAGNRLLLCERFFPDKSYNTIFSINPGLNTLETHFRNNGLFNDSTGIRFTGIGNKIYIYGYGGINVNGIDYGAIAELMKDSLYNVVQDTVQVAVFRDANKNGKYDQGEIGKASSIRELVSRRTYITDASGRLAFYPLDNEDYKFVFEFETKVDSCYASPYSGAVSSMHYRSPIRNSAVEMPIWRTSLQNRNIIVKAYSPGQARLDVSTPLCVSLFSRDCDASSQNITLTMAIDTMTHILSSDPPYSSYSNGVVTYNITVVPFFEKYVTLKVKYPFNNYKLGDTVKHKVRFTGVSQEDTTDNADEIITRLVYSFDPNSKHSEPEGRITSNLKRIRYHINFQNEGNADAWRVTVIDTLNLKMPVYEFMMAGSSHAYVLSHKDNIVTWVFDNINLRPKSKDEEGSKGYIVFDAHVLGELRQGDSIRNRAFIYFDYNKPVVTNHAVIRRKDKDGSIDGNYYQSMYIGAYPNPADGHLIIYNKIHMDQHVYIYDMKGAVVSEMQVTASSEKRIDTSSWAAGIYMVAGSSGDVIRIVIE